MFIALAPPLMMKELWGGRWREEVAQYFGKVGGIACAR